MPGSRWTSGCPWSTDRQRQIEKGRGEAFCTSGIEKTMHERSKWEFLFCVFPPFFSVISIREDVPATLATLPAGGCHRHRERWVFDLSFRTGFLSSSSSSKTWSKTWKCVFEIEWYDWKRSVKKEELLSEIFPCENLILEKSEFQWSYRV